MRCNQNTRSYETFQIEFRERSTLVTANYESKEHPGYINIDLFFASLFLQGVDQTFFARPIEIALEKPALPNLADLTSQFQIYNTTKMVRKGPFTSKTTPPSPSALAAPLASLSLSTTPTPPKPPTPTPPSPKKGPFTRPNLIDPSKPAAQGSCPYCWITRSQDLKHTLDTCHIKLRNDAASRSLNTNTNHTGLVTTFPLLEDDNIPSRSLKADSPSPFYYDNCASVTVTVDFHALENTRLLDTPELLGGIAKQTVSLTHVGFLPFLPPAISKCYYSPNGIHNLISLGYIQQHGYTYHSIGSSAVHIVNPDQTSFEIAHLNENLLPQSSLYSPPLPDPPLSALVVSSHVNQEQRERCRRVIALHNGPAIHCSDTHLKEQLKLGRFPGANVTEQDIDLTRSIHGSCIHCAQASYKKKPMLPSLTPPADDVGKQLVIDIHDLKSKSHLNRTVGIQCVDEFSGDLQFITAVSKSTRHLYDAMMNLIHLRYSKYNHKITQITCDAEPSMKNAVALFAQVGIILTLVDPGQCAQRMEAYIKFQNIRKRAINASLPYHLPDHVDPYLIRWVHDNANAM